MTAAACSRAVTGSRSGATPTTSAPGKTTAPPTSTTAASSAEGTTTSSTTRAGPSNATPPPGSSPPPPPTAANSPAAPTTDVDPDRLRHPTPHRTRSRHHPTRTHGAPEHPPNLKHTQSAVLPRPDPARLPTAAWRSWPTLTPRQPIGPGPSNRRQIPPPAGLKLPSVRPARRPACRRRSAARPDATVVASVGLARRWVPSTSHDPPNNHALFPAIGVAVAGWR